MKLRLIILLLAIIPSLHAQEKLELNREGEKLRQYYLSLGVENHWLAGTHVAWDSGKPDMPESTHGNKTHCSAFTAAACDKAGIYLLHPPEHSQILLANAQYDWLSGKAGAKAGWREISGADRYEQSQTFANHGQIVVAVYQNSDCTRPGHVALVMPKERSLTLLQNEGPELIMAGTHNHNYISLKNAFASHLSSWPENDIRFFLQEKIPSF